MRNNLFKISMYMFNIVLLAIHLNNEYEYSPTRACNMQRTNIVLREYKGFLVTLPMWKKQM